LESLPVGKHGDHGALEREGMGFESMDIVRWLAASAARPKFNEGARGGGKETGKRETSRTGPQKKMTTTVGNGQEKQGGAEKKNRWVRRRNCAPLKETHPLREGKKNENKELCGGKKPTINYRGLDLNL